MSEEKKRKGRYIDAEDWQQKTARKRKRKVNKPGPGEKELKWDAAPSGVGVRRTGRGKWTMLGVLGVFCVLLALGLVLLMKGRDDRDFEVAVRSAEARDEGEDLIEESSRLVDQFLNESDPEKRLKYVRDAEEVRGRMKQYAQEALVEPALTIFPMPFPAGEREFVSKYLVVLKGGGKRELCVLATDDGLKLDWDGYARYGTASWEQLRKGEIDEAEMRAIVSDAAYYNPPFQDSKKWRSYRMESPDMDGWLYLYAERNSDEDLKVQRLLRNDQTWEPEAEESKKEEEPKKFLLGDFPLGGMKNDLQYKPVEKAMKRAMVLKVKTHVNDLGEVMYRLESAVVNGWTK